jgi:thiol-disulfide isomerase/thioredoxin
MADGEAKRRNPAWRWVAGAAVAGVLAGAVAVYATRPQPGNDGPQAASPQADAACAAKAERGRRIADGATGEVAALLPADPPVSFASLSFDGPDGKRLSLADLHGKAVLLNLWATWCAPCRAEMPALDRLEQAKGGAGFEVVAVNLDTGGPEKPQKFLEETGVEALKRYRDPSLDLFEALKARGLALGLPATFLLDRDGCLLALMNGPAEWSSPDAMRVVDAALKG